MTGRQCAGLLFWVRRSWPPDAEEAGFVKRIKSLKVVKLPQDNNYVPWVRVAGNWLIDAGFNYGDKVLLIASEGEIVIRKAEDEVER